MYAIPLGSAYGVGKFVLGVERLNEVNEAAEEINPITNFVNIFSFVTFDNFYTLRKGVFVLWLALLVVALVLKLVAVGRDWLKTAFGFAYILVGCIVVSFLIYITGTSDACWPRMIYSYGIIFGVLSFYLLNGEENLKAAHFLIIATAIIVLCADYISFEKTFVDRYKCNQEDLYFAEIIDQRISEYEEETGNVVDTICFYSDNNITYYGRGYEKSRLSQRAETTVWSRQYSLFTYLDKVFEEGEKDPEIEEYFRGQDWNTFSEKQLIFRDNVLHLCAY